MNPVKVGLIGFGRMGGFYLDEMQKSGRWDVAYICDVCAESRDLARKLAPGAKVVDDEQVIFDDPEVQVVGLFALADSRKSQIERAFAAGKHVIAEKPISDSIENEWQAVELAENTPLFSTVNLYLRNSWYHNTIKDFIAQGEIGELAIIRVCHMTPGLAPGEGHEYEGPAFHDCGMHYVDIARWYAQSEFKTWNAQAVRMWNYKDPWWLQCHGTFENGVVFDITQGHVYGQLAQTQTHNSYVDIIGTKDARFQDGDRRAARRDADPPPHPALRGQEHRHPLQALRRVDRDGPPQRGAPGVPRRGAGLGVRLAVPARRAGARPPGHRGTGDPAADPRTPPHDEGRLRPAAQTRMTIA